MTWGGGGKGLPGMKTQSTVPGQCPTADSGGGLSAEQTVGSH